MAKKLGKLLKTDSMGDLDTKVLAQILKSKGRKGDTMLAHINPQEAALLKKRGGSGTKNPETGLPEFFVIDGDYAYGADYGNQSSSSQSSSSPAAAMASYSAPSASDYSFSYGGDYFGDAASANPAAAAMASRSAPSYQDFDLPPPSYQDVTSAGYGQDMRRLYAPTATNVRGEIGDVSGSYAPIISPQINRPGAPNIPGAPGAPGAEAKDDSFFNKNFLRQLGLAGISAIPGIYQSRKAQEQAQRARAEQQAIADPYRKEGQALLDKARSGELNAVGQQQMQQLEARLRQGQEARGGVGNAQVQAQMEAYRQQLLQNQYDLGLKVSGIGDQIALGAIKTGMEADRYVGELTGNYYNNMFRILSGSQLQPAPPRG